jgi:hypothetical protein
MFFILLAINKETKDFGKDKLKKYFVIDDNIINDDLKMIEYFYSLSQ